jgi:hypothetical protein
MAIPHTQTRDDTGSFSSQEVPAGGTLEPSSFLVLVLQSDRPLASSVRFCLSELNRIDIGRGSDRAYHRAGPELSVEVDDALMSATHAQISRVVESWMIEDKGSKNGVIVNGEVRPKAVLSDGDILELGRTFFLFRTGVPADRDLPAVFDSRDLRAPASQWGTFLCTLARELQALEQVAKAPLPLLLTGETGTGKEVLARGVHSLSERRGPFVAVNCGGLPENLIESELFGYRKGAFSGATEDRPGLVRSAEGGTLFLDEIGDLPPSSQAALLRVLQEHEVLPLGATQPVAVDFRLVAATNRTLPALVERGTFRADLLARLAGHTVHLPPLRDRREDLGLIIRELLGRVAGSAADRFVFDRHVVRQLLSYHWPFNVRELENGLMAAAALATDGRIRLEHLPKTMTSDRAALAESTSGGSEDSRRAELAQLLEVHGGNVSAVARAMGKARAQVQRWMKRYGLKRIDALKQE